MTATTPPQMEGTHAPSQVEYLYERYKHLLTWLLVAVVIGFAVFYGYKWQRQSQIDQTWTQFSTTIGLEGIYTSEDGFESLADQLADKTLPELDAALAQADPVRAPLLLLVIARKAMMERDWARAESALAELEQKYPGHLFVQKSDYPVQVREVKEDEKDADPDKSGDRPNQKPDLEAPVSGSIVDRMRLQIAEARGYEMPPQFAKPEIPADAPKVKFTFSGDYGSVTIALMKDKAPELVDQFLKLAKGEYTVAEKKADEPKDDESKDGEPKEGEPKEAEGEPKEGEPKEGEPKEDAPQEKKPFWVGMNVDEIQRPVGRFQRPMQFHLGFGTTREADRTKWLKTDPSEHTVEFQDTGLSHFPGAVAARSAADGKSAVDRFYVCAEDAAQQDGQREVFGYVVEGLENVKLICEAAMTAQEEESGLGVPTDNITVESVEIIE